MNAMVATTPLQLHSGSLDGLRMPVYSSLKGAYITGHVSPHSQLPGATYYSMQTCICEWKQIASKLLVKPVVDMDGDESIVGHKAQSCVHITAIILFTLQEAQHKWVSCSACRCPQQTTTTTVHAAVGFLSDPNLRTPLLLT